MSAAKLPPDTPITPRLYEIWSAGTREFPGFAAAIEEYGKQVWQASRKAALNDAVAICMAVSVQEIDVCTIQYQEGRDMGATVCANKIKELFK